MVKRKIVEAIDKQERIKRRKELGKLGNLVIRPATADRYEKAFQKILSFLTSQKLAIGSQKTIVDSQLSSFLENLWEEGESIYFISRRFHFSSAALPAIHAEAFASELASFENLATTWIAG